MTIKKTKICENCGASFVPESENQTLCSECSQLENHNHSAKNNG